MSSLVLWLRSNMTSNTLKLSAAFVDSSRPLSTVTFPESSYVLSIAELQSHYAAAASSPSNAICILDKSDPRVIVRSLPGHTEGISYMRTARLLQGAHDVLLSCGADGRVKTWDERAGTVGVQMQNLGRRVPLLCCDASPNGNLVAAGTALQGEDAVILYWDPRNPSAPLRRHTSTHSDDITAVHFAQHGSAITLLSASSDGLLCTSNPLEENEDESNTAIGNWGCSISKAGWLHRDSGLDGSGIWAASDMETLSFWSDEVSLERNHPIGADVESLASLDSSIKSNKLVESGWYNRTQHFLGGDIALVSPHQSDDQWSLEQLYTRGHSEIVRSILWDEDAGLLLSGGEDARLIVWSSPVQFSQNGTGHHVDMDVEPPQKREFDDRTKENTYRLIIQRHGIFRARA
ncbi:WD40 repeat-like protein [Sanghuangporus baumii]|uniref:WD40 repeat-like protein n=1 Tax=Sanghuangporus baumii TaxID=108892 RepID=A0A9Q5HR95_SANBA|nr:WD40 repeat-like protein [Sanghuangporus baumii]